MNIQTTDFEFQASIFIDEGKEFYIINLSKQVKSITIKS